MGRPTRLGTLEKYLRAAFLTGNPPDLSGKSQMNKWVTETFNVKDDDSFTSYQNDIIAVLEKLNREGVIGTIHNGVEKDKVAPVVKEKVRQVYRPNKETVVTGFLKLLNDVNYDKHYKRGMRTELAAVLLEETMQVNLMIMIDDLKDTLDVYEGINSDLQTYRAALQALPPEDLDRLKSYRNTYAKFNSEAMGKLHPKEKEVD